MKNNVVICPPCGENVALATKEGQNKENALWPLLPRLTAVLPPQGREITTHGFTLIELLVVVLIIGILAAVAVPQYQKAVEKSRATEAITTLSSLEKAVSLWVLENGLPRIPTAYFLGGSKVRNASLSIDLPCEPFNVGGTECLASSGIYYFAYCGSVCAVGAGKVIGDDWYVMVSETDNTGKWSFHKCGYSGNSAKAVCDMLAAQGWDTEEDWDY